MTRLGYQLPNFTFPDTTSDQIFGKVVAQAKAAEAAGFDRLHRREEDAADGRPVRR